MVDETTRTVCHFHPGKPLSDADPADVAVGAGLVREQLVAFGEELEHLRGLIDVRCGVVREIGALKRRLVVEKQFCVPVDVVLKGCCGNSKRASSAVEQELLVDRVIPDMHAGIGEACIRVLPCM